MSRIAVGITKTEEHTIFLDPSEFRGLNDLDVVIAIQRELGPGLWCPEDIATAAGRLIEAAKETGGGA